MKRVIVLSWFKTIVDRLFGPDEDNNKVEIEYEETENEIDESLNKNETKNSTSFRFPIISDAEIYGWDDEPVTKVDYPKTQPKMKMWTIIMKRNHFPKMLNGQVITEQSISSGLNHYKNMA